jgi:hypothetical protein
VWLSVDPMSDQYPSLSPYTYCANNPIMMVDPDGRFVIDPSIKKISTYLYKYLTTQLQKDIIGNKLIMKGLMYFGDMTEEQIIEKTTNGKGPRIMFTTDEISKYNYRNDEGDILLSNSSKVRSSIFNDKNGSDYDKNLVLFDIFQTILHEFVHYGQQRLGAGEERKNLPQHRLIIDGVVSNQFKNPKFDIGFLFASMVFHNSDWSKTVETFEDSKEAFDRFNQLPDNVEKPLPTLIK